MADSLRCTCAEVGPATCGILKLFPQRDFTETVESNVIHSQPARPTLVLVLGHHLLLQAFRSGNEAAAEKLADARAAMGPVLIWCLLLLLTGVLQLVYSVCCCVGMVSQLAAAVVW
jgi:hypothetical protein